MGSIRGFNASASLKPFRSTNLFSHTLTGIRGFNASASLKQRIVVLAQVGAESSIRGFNASASLKPPEKVRLDAVGQKYPRL